MKQHVGRAPDVVFLDAAGECFVEFQPFDPRTFRKRPPCPGSFFTLDKRTRSSALCPARASRARAATAPPKLAVQRGGTRLASAAVASVSVRRGHGIQQATAVGKCYRLSSKAISCV